jgi:uncharacterized protein (TIGR02453 family)
MKPAHDLAVVLRFLNELRGHNNKAWFDAHRAAYEKAKQNFEDFVDDLIVRVEKFDNLEGISATDCTFRINRDVRFSRDKSPYKTAMGAHITPGGRHSGRLGYYLHLEPMNKSLIAGGLHMPEPAQLNQFRKAIAENAAPFKKIVGAKEFVRSFGAVGGDKLVTAPQGYARDHPEIELLRLKTVTVAHPVLDAEAAAPDFAAQTAKIFRTMKPFLDYLNGVGRG